MWSNVNNIVLKNLNYTKTFFFQKFGTIRTRRPEDRILFRMEEVHNWNAAISQICAPLKNILEIILQVNYIVGLYSKFV